MSRRRIKLLRKIPDAFLPASLERLKRSTAITIKAVGAINLEATSITIGDHAVRPVPDPV